MGNEVLPLNRMAAAGERCRRYKVRFQFPLYLLNIIMLVKSYKPPKLFKGKKMLRTLTLTISEVMKAIDDGILICHATDEAFYPFIVEVDTGLSYDIPEEVMWWQSYLYWYEHNRDYWTAQFNTPDV